MEIRRSTKDRPLSFAVHDRPPVAKVPTSRRDAAYVATIGSFVVLFVAALSLAKAVLVPVLAAFVIGAMLSPVAERAEQYRVPPALSAFVLALAVFAVFNGLIIAISAPVVDWAGKAPQIGHTIREKLYVLEGSIAALQHLRDAVLPAEGGTAVRLGIADMVQPILLFLTPAIGQLLVFFGTLFFYLFGRTDLRRILVAAFDQRDNRLRALRILNDVDDNLVKYVSLVTVINLTVGLAGGGVAWMTGLPNPIAWGVLAFLLNYIPYVGPLIVELLMFGVGLITFDTLGQAAMAPIAYIVFTTVEGHFLTPSIIGRQLTLNPLLVFLALVFWTWLWGPAGAFLAMPLLIAGLVISSHLFPDDEPALPD